MVAEGDEALFGADQTEGVVAIELTGDDGVTLFIRKGDSLLEEVRPFHPFAIVQNPDVAERMEGVADVPAGSYAVTLNAAGTDTQAFPAEGAVDLGLAEGVNTIVYAIGDLAGGTFDLIVSTIDLEVEAGDGDGEEPGDEEPMPPTKG